ncbi:phosphatidate cytidylyltransferase [Primorskyibacter flagellatus]|uniref:Phosphatidate cytidylyltransferase n=1 Tax=Primorskyibacter flagellatus TaxID=1387277 RepID=A0A917A4X5_9RHOB|nr:UDP-2,3-diacylglucosamine diphosphatase LpxI [Primorskyibacter flagellatus]GGE27053.1 phosphatidate cytidylyltransferase [Primorskyibacter flagellatus]
MSRLGIIAGGGALPAALAAADPDALCIAFAGAEVAVPEARIQRHRMEHLGALFSALRAAGVTRVVLAGAMSRPALDPAALDPVMTALAPRIMAAMQGGDDGLLRLVIAIFEEQGFAVTGAHDLLPDLTATPGLLTGPEPSDTARADIARARAILDALSPVDVGQGCVVASGLCLGVETLQGTDALLGFVAATPRHLRGRGGVLVKRPKLGQDLRVDMPAIGPATVQAAARAGLDGIAIAAGGVMLLDRPALLAAAEANGLFLLAEP